VLFLVVTLFHFSFDALLGIIFHGGYFHLLGLVDGKGTPILLEYCPLVIILLLGTTASICAVSSSVVLASVLPGFQFS